jgi:hypothetical protein
MNARCDSKRHGARIGALLLAVLAGSVSARTLTPIDVARDAPAASDAPAARLAGAVHVDARYGVPTFLWGTETTSAQVAGSPEPKATFDAEAAARAHLRDRAATYRITTEEIDALAMHNLQRLPNGGAIVRFRNQVDGIEVFREEANVLLDRSGGLVAIGGFVTGRPAGPEPRAAGEVLQPEFAAAAALADFKFGPATALRMTSAPAEGGYVMLALPAGTVSDDGSSLVRTARAKHVWFRNGSALLPAYYVEVRVRDGAQPRHTDYYAYVVSATDGTLLFRKSQVAHVAFSYRVFAEPGPAFLPLPGPGGRNGFPHPTGTPDGYQAPFVASTLITLSNAPFSKNDPWLAPGATKTIGNNAEAFADLFAPDLFGPAATSECNTTGAVDGDLHACANGAGAFDYTYDFTRDPDVTRNQVMAGVTHSFYLVNFFHDWYYDAGFDEAAGNAQTVNFGRGGLGNDALLAVAQDYNGVDDAYMVTPADGQAPELHMFVWVDGAVLAKVSLPAAIAGAKDTGSATFGALAYDLTADVVQAIDAANATGPTATDGCSTFTNAAAVVGKIALIDRGTCLFVDKARNAQSAGAAAALIVNNVAPGPINMSGDDATITIPTISISQADGNAIKAQLLGRVSMRLARKVELRDGSIDTMVNAHEWGHYISNRLIANANGLNANQALGMGEGWADFHEMLLLVKDNDRNLPANANFNGTYSSNAYAIAGPDFPPDIVNNAYYYGDRRYPYTRDMSKNPLTFRHITAGVPLPASPVPSLQYASPDNSEVHSAGEVWASMLWECYSNLLLDTGRLTFAQAQERMKRYLVAAYKMTPVDPTFVTARDALFSVMKAQDVNDYNQCLHGFAKRGAGLGAVAPGSLSADNTGVVESFMTVKPAVGAKAAAIEYHHAEFDHYFVTAIADEIAKLDNGTFVGWARTGESFNVYTDFPIGSAGVCRFFSTAFSPKSSHFYTPDVNECGIVKQNASWQFEGVVFGVLAAGPNGECPAGSIPVYRLYNNGQGAAPNHRYTTSLVTRATMLANGWIPEGYGAIGVIMCSPT